ncbi:MAG: papain-like cysteine protease family protein [Oceanicaulis sp.]
MAMRLHELDRRLETRPRKTSHAAPRRKPRARGLQALDVSIEGTAPVLAQPSSMACWATVYTMLSSWKHDRSMTIPDALQDVGPRWVALFNSNTGISSAAKNDFIAAAGLVAEPPMNPTIEAWADMLRRYGPIWITTDEAAGPANWAIHARVLTAIKGDGTATGTQIKVIDPAGGRSYWEPFSVFLRKFESEARHSRSRGPLRVQMIHWPEGARAAAQSWTPAAMGAPARAYGGADLSDEALSKLGLSRQDVGELAAAVDQAPTARAQSAPARAFGATSLPHVRLPAGHWTSRLVQAVQRLPIVGDILTAAFDICDRYNVTIALGYSVSAGAVGGAGASYGLVIGPGRRVGVFGSVSGLLGALVSLSGSLSFTVVFGTIDDFSGTSVTVGAAISSAVGLEISAHWILSPGGRTLGFTGEIGATVGPSPFEAFVGAHATGSVTARGHALGAPGVADAFAYVSALADDIPLSPAAGGRSIGLDALRKADILVSTTTARVSRLIRWATDAPVSHASIYTGNRTVIEAVGDGVVETPLDDIMNDPETSLAVAFRYEGDAPQGWRDTAVNYAGAQLGRRYDFLNVVRQPQFRNAAENCNVMFESERARRLCRRTLGPVNLMRGADTSFFCSELVARAYQEAGVQLIGNMPAQAVSPADYTLAATLTYVGHLKYVP